MLGWLLDGRKAAALLTHVADWGEWRRVAEADGTLHAFSRDADVTVMPHGKTRLFIRNAIVKNVLTGNTRTRRMVVAELDGVHLHVLDGRLLLSPSAARISEALDRLMTPIPPRDGNTYTHHLPHRPEVKLTMRDRKLILSRGALA